MYIFFFSILSGSTYDRSIVVDEEEASIILYDIWEQVRYPQGFHGCCIIL